MCARNAQCEDSLEQLFVFGLLHSSNRQLFRTWIVKKLDCAKLSSNIDYIRELDYCFRCYKSTIPIQKRASDLNQNKTSLCPFFSVISQHVSNEGASSLAVVECAIKLGGGTIFLYCFLPVGLSSSYCQLIGYS